MQRNTLVPAPILMGFLIVEPTKAKDGYIGAIMVTNEKGYPLEFRATTPVRPTPIQRALFGGSLEHFVGLELCAKALLSQTQRKPEIILLSDHALLSVEVNPAVTLVYIRRTGEQLTLGEPDQRDRLARGRLDPQAKAFPSIVYEMASGQEEKGSKAFKAMQEASHTSISSRPSYE